MSDPWRITLFGGLRAQRKDQVITRFKTQKVASLFAYLAYHLRQAHSREILIEMLWPESDAPTLRNSLSVALSSLRNQFEPPGVAQGTIIRADRFSVGLNPAAVSTDVQEFESAIKRAGKSDSPVERMQSLSEAVELCIGPLLPGFYDDWISAEQERLFGLYFDAVGELISHLEGAGDTRSALVIARRAVAADSLREQGQIHLIRLLAADGQHVAALRQFKEFERLLEEEVADVPSEALRSIVAQIEKASGSAGTVLLPAVKTRKSGPAVPAGGPATFTLLATEETGAGKARHTALLRAAFERHRGQELRASDGGFIIAFSSATAAIACAVEIQRELEASASSGSRRDVRMALHTGDIDLESESGRTSGDALSHVSQILAAARGMQILAGESTAVVVQRAPGGVRLVELGLFRLRGASEPKRLYQVEYPGMAQTTFEAPLAEAGSKSNVPPRFTRFFGREGEIEQLREAVSAPGARLVTLTGPAGNGKTRLAMEAAERLADIFSGAVFFVSLADLNDPALIPSAILDSLGKSQSHARDPLDQAIDELRKHETLLVLDNFEHLVEGGAAMVQTLLAEVPNLRIVITSRALLGLSAERQLVLSPLPVPGTDESPEQLSVYDSVQLFIDRAQQVMPHFQVSNANAAAVASLVAGLEGIPLAIELAAARVQVFTPAQMLAQLSNRFAFLASRKRDVAERQRTLRGAVEWSYRLLGPEMQRFFARLSVFRGGWSVEAAEIVCEEPLALDYLEQLRECSLVLPGDLEQESSRFRMLETLREYGLERLEKSRETEAVRHRHLAYYLDLAEEVAPHLNGPDQGVWLSRLEDEHGNLRAALEQCSEDDRAAGVRLRLCAALWRFWYARGHVSEGRSRCVEALGEAQEEKWTSARAKVLNGVGVIAWRQGDYGAARAFLEESLTIYEERRDTEGMASSLTYLGNVAHYQGDLAAARELQEKSLAIERKKGRTRIAAVSLNNLGNVAIEQGDYPAARALYEESLSIFREVGDRTAVGLLLTNLGGVAKYQGEYASARSLLEESLAVQREVDNQWGIAVALSESGLVACEQGDFASAHALLKQSLPIMREFGDWRGLAVTVDGLADVTATLGHSRWAARLWGAAERIREDIGSPMTSGERPRYQRRLSEARAALGDDAAFDSAWQEGRAMRIEEVIAYVLSE